MPKKKANRRNGGRKGGWKGCGGVVLFLFLEPPVPVDHLMDIAASGRSAHLARLISRGGVSNINELCSVGCSVLYVACEAGYTDVARVLLSAKASVNQKTIYDLTPLFVACNAGHANLARLLLSAKENVDQMSNSGQRTTSRWLDCCCLPRQA